MQDVVLSWQPSPSSTVVGYNVSWTWFGNPKVVAHPATDTSASFVTDTGAALHSGLVVSATITAHDALGQNSPVATPAHGSVTIPTPPPPQPPTSVDLTITGTP